MKYIVILALLSSCMSTRMHNRLMRDYQVLLHMDTVWIYDGKRLVNKFVHQSECDWHNKYDSIMIKDNQ
jgi:hypothetical protein